MPDLHIVLVSILQTGTIPTDLLRGVVSMVSMGLQQSPRHYPAKSTKQGTLLLSNQRLKQSGSTIERHHEFRRGLCAAYISFKKAFNMLHQD